MILARPLKLAHTVPLEQLLARGGKEIDYTYDFGDNWQLSISLEEVITDYLHPMPFVRTPKKRGRRKMWAVPPRL